MTNQRRSADGFDGTYPKPLDWDKIIAELTTAADTQRPTDEGRDSGAEVS